MNEQQTHSGTSTETRLNKYVLANTEHQRKPRPLTKPKKGKRTTNTREPANTGTVDFCCVAVCCSEIEVRGFAGAKIFGHQLTLFDLPNEKNTCLFVKCRFIVFFLHYWWVSSVSFGKKVYHKLSKTLLTPLNISSPAT